MAVTPSLSLVPAARPAPRVDFERTAVAVEVLAHRADALLQAYRWHGHRAAAIDPLSEPPDPFNIHELDPRHHGLALDDSVAFDMAFGGVVENLTLSQLVSRLRASYCGPIALECAHVRSEEQRRWLCARIEAIGDAPPLASPEALRLLERLVAVEAFEHRRRVAYPQYKQFNLEGSESFVPLLRAVIEQAIREGAENLVLAMPHRGRLNAMLNALEVPRERLLSLLSPNPDASLSQRDLRDHAGLAGRIDTAQGSLEVVLLHNPSHLESVTPVACGVARALQDRKAGGSVRKVLPVIVHGDGSFCGQGVVAETFNLAQTRGYGIGGTLHLILNNHVGSTISHPRDQRSTLYCADLARAFDAPVLHVNADQPEAVVVTAAIATEFRMKFGADVVVDHVGYRRYGHWVGDDPTLTRPATQRRIDAHPAVVSLYAATLARRGVTGEHDAERLRAEALARLAAANEAAAGDRARPAHADAAAQGPAQPIHTAVPVDQLRALAMRLATPPEGFATHPAIDKMRADWRAIAQREDRPVDWRFAENLAYATLLANGFNIRLTGLDVGRGSFCHRQHLWHDQAVDVDWREIHVPLRRIAERQGSFAIFETPLSEEAVLGFEYGYSLRCGRDLVVWEGQFGDFVNNAQVIIDQFIATGAAKWGYESGLVMLLPHGDDGLGPEHSCAFLGRFLQLCAGGNIEVAMPSSAAQAYHLLRRQALRRDRRPLVVMTPKPWLYGHAPSYSRLEELAEGEFRPVLGEEPATDPEAVRRVVVTSGKFYYDLASARAAPGLAVVPILRAEQLHPFPVAALASALSAYPRLAEVVWAQEEPKNHGSWHVLREELEAALPAGVALAYSGRPPMAPTASADAAAHPGEQRALARAALGIAAS
ncbi:MAG TPA: 2-oxoglutarate dehydrogenase E1 component [Casimicrobiaceae bacterium]|nr:2-oxoglutarate dehydrogenase E1 component [Casimicrobiaceae bacterium]